MSLFHSNRKLQNGLPPPALTLVILKRPCVFSKCHSSFGSRKKSAFDMNLHDNRAFSISLRKIVHWTHFSKKVVCRKKDKRRPFSVTIWKKASVACIMIDCTYQMQKKLTKCQNVFFVTWIFYWKYNGFFWQKVVATSVVLSHKSTLYKIVNPSLATYQGFQHIPSIYSGGLSLPKISN